MTERDHGDDNRGQAIRYNPAVLPAARPKEPAISRGLFLTTVASLRSLDVDVETPLAQLGLRISDLSELPERMKPAVMSDLWSAVYRSTGRGGYGLRMAERATFDQFPTFGRLLATSATIGDALVRGVRLFRLLSERQRFVVRLDGRQVVVVLETTADGSRLHREGAEFLIGGLAVLGRKLTGRTATAKEVRFMHAAHAEAFEVKTFFGCPVRFGASENALIFDSDFLFAPIPTHDPSACAALQREAESLLSELREPTAFRRDVVNAISTELAEGRSGIRDAATRLGMHPKTLGRSLQADGTTYRELLDEVRLHLAQRYLEQGTLCVAEIAFRLGYSEKSAFNRAFKRWTGRTPESFRVG